MWQGVPLKGTCEIALGSLEVANVVENAFPKVNGRREIELHVRQID